MPLLRRTVIAVLVVFVGWIAPAAPAAPADPPTRLNPRDFGARQILVVHWSRLDEAYDGWNVWAWIPGKDGRAHPLAGTDAFGRYAVIPITEPTDRVGIIVRRGEWQEKDGDGDRFVQIGAEGVREVWLVAGDARIHATPPKLDRVPRIEAAFLDARDRVLVATNVPLGKTDTATIAIEGANPALRAASVRPAKPAGATRPMLELKLSRPVSDRELSALRVRLPGAEPVIVYARGVFDEPAFTPTSATLGAECTAASTTFRTWSPVSESVELLLSADPASPGPDAVIPLKAGKQGTWECTVPGDLHGRAYAYRFRHYGSERVVPDIHAHAATADSSRSVVVDLTRVEPAGWRDTPVPTLAQATDEVIYEIHVRDFSVADASCPAPARGTYLGLVHAGTAGAGQSTGLAHLKELGVTAVHLMPVHDFTAATDAYNWGYWTALFNVPEGNYASAKGDPLAPVRELRTAIQALHGAGLRVVLDVVYNHTSSSGVASPFDGTVPYWFFRTTPDGRYTNDAGCGNSVADERPMVRKYILDSLAFWLDAYRVDGFRFDLLGTHDPATVRAACELVRARRPDATLYGEPWTGGGPIRFGKGAQKGMSIAVFNDHLRNAIRGDLDGNASGFATGPGGDRDAIRRGVAGAIDDFTQEPAETINYASAHDNLSLVDKIAKAAPAADAATRRAMQKLALGVVLVSQGIPFIEGGSEICRTKQGNHNSYEAGDAINRFDWDAKAGCREVSDYVAGLIAMRRAHPAFRMADDAQVRRAIDWVDVGPAVAWTIDGAPAKDPAKRLFVALNGEPVPVAVRPPAGRWRVLVDAATAGAAPRDALGTSVTLPPYSMLVAAE
jgi:pullulanase